MTTKYRHIALPNNQRPKVDLPVIPANAGIQHPDSGTQHHTLYLSPF